MRIILSRKGFDSSYGGKPSPIFSDGTLCSLPIPEGKRGQQATCYDDICFGNHSLGHLVEDLTNGKVKASRRVHLDPDLCPGSLPRRSYWRPLFGQTGAAEGHLRNRGISSGDLFLFFGWFREVEQVNNRYRYVKAAPDLHVLFGWLQIGARIDVETETDLPDWLTYHPHVYNRDRYSQHANTLYLAPSTLKLPSRSLNQPGAGTFPQFSAALQLTAPAAASRSLWELPRWFYPAGRPSALSYHTKPNRWQLGNRSTYLRSVCQGQEFVLDCQHYPEAINWVAALLT
ncbi:hypothetical protein PN498_20705 [Oscillatoria sp. CS-180]|uniref:Nmad3 family putative nucleotide modification protein n=1 Tax=Oscillatoria sp. CS-180 TaxID=3021720 RepID=UPI00232EB9A8|nr:hypothetical protein [Oscillatoria sp. CS-180]MDB9528425.1 hypothetical protein [Oscillatoria sp. CS-180]